MRPSLARTNGMWIASPRPYRRSRPPVQQVSRITSTANPTCLGGDGRNLAVQCHHQPGHHRQGDESRFQAARSESMAEFRSDFTPCSMIKSSMTRSIMAAHWDCRHGAAISTSASLMSALGDTMHSPSDWSLRGQEARPDLDLRCGQRRQPRSIRVSSLGIRRPRPPVRLQQDHRRCFRR